MKKLLEFWNDRKAVLFLLLFPGFLGVIAMALAITLTGFGVPQVGSWRSNVAGLAYVFLFMLVLGGPSYFVGVGWHAWRLRHSSSIDKDDVNNIWKILIFVVLFFWFPMVFFIPKGAWAGAIGMLLTALFCEVLVCGVWLGLVRVGFKLWRGK